MLIFALDTESDKAKKIAMDFFPYVEIFKIGSRLFTASGHEIVRWIHRHKRKVFLDLKFHDIPSTVAECVKNAVRMKVWGLTVHTLGGYAMMKEAVKAAEQEAKKIKVPRPLLLGVTILTSLNNNGLKKIGIFQNISQQVTRLAALAKNCGLDGVVASGKEIAMIRKVCGKKFLIAVPGVRFARQKSADQKRIVTPEEARSLGANYWIAGRAILQAHDPLDAIKKMQ